MRLSYLFAATVAAAAALLSEPPVANAQPDMPYCAIYTTQGASRMCSFATREQCLLGVSGIGGRCVESLSYNPASTPRRQR
jgi:Protein of unknown function (DUF3551)